MSKAKKKTNASLNQIPAADAQLAKRIATYVLSVLDLKKSVCVYYDEMDPEHKIRFKGDQGEYDISGCYHVWVFTAVKKYLDRSGWVQVILDWNYRYENSVVTWLRAEAIPSRKKTFELDA